MACSITGHRRRKPIPESRNSHCSRRKRSGLLGEIASVLNTKTKARIRVLLGSVRGARTEFTETYACNNAKCHAIGCTNERTHRSTNFKSFCSNLCYDVCRIISAIYDLAFDKTKTYSRYPAWRCWYLQTFVPFNSAVQTTAAFPHFFVLYALSV